MTQLKKESIRGKLKNLGLPTTVLQTEESLLSTNSNEDKYRVLKISLYSYGSLIAIFGCMFLYNSYPEVQSVVDSLGVLALVILAGAGVVASEDSGI